jgi:hypothetical protein
MSKRPRFFIARARAHSRAERKEMIDRKHPLPLTRQSEILELSRSSLYYEAVPTSGGDLELMRLVDEIHLKYPFMGSRGIRDQLQDMGHKVGRQHVGTLMRKMGIAALYRKPNLSKPHPQHKVNKGPGSDQANYVKKSDECGENLYFMPLEGCFYRVNRPPIRAGRSEERWMRPLRSMLPKRLYHLAYLQQDSITSLYLRLLQDFKSGALSKRSCLLEIRLRYMEENTLGDGVNSVNLVKPSSAMIAGRTMHC